MPKDFNLRNMVVDLEYSIMGTDAHVAIYKACPPKEGLSVLEAGCGSGKFGLAYALKGCGEVVMIDVDEEVLNYARRLRDAVNDLRGCRREGVAALPTSYLNRSVFKMPEDWTNRFDFVFAEGTAQHWIEEDLRQGCIDEMVRVSKGIVLIMGNNGLREEEQHADQFFSFTYKGMPPKRRCFTPDELRVRLSKAGLRNLSIGGVTPGLIEDSYLIVGWGTKSDVNSNVDDNKL